jgi:hypothetical protein
MGKTLNFIISIAVVFYIIDYVQKQDKKNKKDISFSKEVYTGVPDDVKDNSPIKNEESTNIDEFQNDEPSTKSVSKTIYVRALGDVDNSDLESTSQIIKDFYGYNVEILSQVDVDSEMLTPSGDVSSIKVCRILDDEVTTVYITDNLLYDYNNQLLRGTTSGDNKTIIVRGETRFLRETVIHELGHSFGLDHCDDMTCIMAVANDQYDSGDFCNKCKNKIVY